MFFKGINISAFSLAEKEKYIIPDISLKDCCLLIYEVDSINNAIKLLNKNNQTLICIGLSNEIKKELALKAGIEGTDRIVNPGNALAMDIFWDGYDIVNFLSRLISIN